MASSLGVTVHCILSKEVECTRLELHAPVVSMSHGTFHYLEFEEALELNTHLTDIISPAYCLATQATVFV